MTELLVTTFMWYDPKWQHNDKWQPSPDDVRLLQRMVKRNMNIPHEFAVVTDRPELFKDDEFRAIPIDWATHVPGRCYVRLFTFHPDGKNIFGADRILQLDLDAVVTGDMAPLVDRDEDIVLWKNPARIPWKDAGGKFAGRAFYNGSMVLYRCGSMNDIYNGFLNNPKWRELYKDDQWLYSALFEYKAPVWDESDGVYRLARADTPGSGVNGKLPENARIVFFPGDKAKCWHPHVLEQCPWIPKYRW